MHAFPSWMGLSWAKRREAGSGQGGVAPDLCFPLGRIENHWLFRWTLSFGEGCRYKWAGRPWFVVWLTSEKAHFVLPTPPWCLLAWNPWNGAFSFIFAAPLVTALGTDCGQKDTEGFWGWEEQHKQQDEQPLYCATSIGGRESLFCRDVCPGWTHCLEIPVWYPAPPGWRQQWTTMETAPVFLRLCPYRMQRPALWAQELIAKAVF